MVILTTIAESHSRIKRRGCEKALLRKLHDNRILWHFNNAGLRVYIIMYTYFESREATGAWRLVIFSRSRVCHSPMTHEKVAGKASCVLT